VLTAVRHGPPVDRSTVAATGDGGIPPRDAAERGLKRIMTDGGAYGLRNYTVKDLRDAKGTRVLTETLPFSPEEAAATEEAGIDTMKCRFDPANPGPAIAIRQAAPRTFMAASVPLVAAATADEAVRLGYEAMKADCVRVAAFQEYIADLRSGAFPGPEHVVRTPDGLIDAFIGRADRG
jgi:hypothetical protein